MSKIQLRILHITDLHMRCAQPGTADQKDRRSREIPDILDRLKAKLPHWSPDMIVMTGDLLDVPDNVVFENLATEDADAFAEAVRHAGADYTWMREWLTSTDLPWVVIPGNHDHRGAFVDTFGTTSPDTVIQGWRFIGFDDALDNHRAPIRTTKEQSRFETSIAPETDAIPQIHLQHYLLRPRVHRRTPYSYKLESSLAARVDASTQVRAVLSGHYHPGAYTKSAAKVTYSTAPAFCEAPFPVRLMDLDAETVLGIEDHSVD